MPDSTGPVLLVVGGDAKRLQWLTHHVTSHWPSAQVTTVPAPTRLARPVRRGARPRCGDPADRLRRRGAWPAPVSSTSTQMLRAQPSHLLHHTRRTRQRAIGGEGAQERREGLSAARPHHPRCAAEGRQRRLCETGRAERAGRRGLARSCRRRALDSSARLQHRQGDRHQQFLLGVPRAQRRGCAATSCSRS